MVDRLNSTYSSVDGVVFNQSQTTLVQYPGGKLGGYTIPDSVTSIGDFAFVQLDQRHNPRQGYQCWGLCVLWVLQPRQHHPWERRH